MKKEEIRLILSHGEGVEERAFEILQGIARYVNDEEGEEIGRDLVLRALERRVEFGGFSEVLDGLTREVGLFPYLDQEELSLKDSLAYEFHRPDESSDFVFHRVQAQVFRRLIDGENVILSAPTSFGKSRVIDSIISAKEFQNIVILVPSIALIDETRRRLVSFSPSYKIVSQLSQRPDKRNIFVFTAERLNAYEELPPIDFFVIDEFYKIGAISDRDQARFVALNQAFYRLSKSRGQFYLLGPSVKAIPDGIEAKLPCYFFPTRFSTVASDVVEVYNWDNDLDELLKLCSEIDEPTLIFCKSPARVNEVARALVEKEIVSDGRKMGDAARWISENFHPKWIYPLAITHGVGLHHGRLPRSLGQLSVRAFNENKIKFLICTSTLIEGVNTCAKNVIIFDNVINKVPVDFFTFNNIRGRCGRMFEHFVGRVYLFHPPPQEELPYVDFPAITQGAEVPESLLIQMEREDLSSESDGRVDEIYRQTILPIEVIRKNSTLDPLAQIELAKELSGLKRSEASLFWWKRFPDYDGLLVVARLLWKYFVAGRKHGVSSPEQLTLKLWKLKSSPGIKGRILEELRPGKYQAASPDEAVERVFSFDRNWAGFEFPRLLMAVSRIQQHIFDARFGVSGNYALFAARCEQLFRNPALVALEEYGLPIQLGERIAESINLSEDLDVAIKQVKEFDPAGYGFDRFEVDLLKEVQRGV
ncbi:DEAD/DEAH box helicase [Terrimicrobium sacchariphilum]|uniref:DEAD/DEAH box helicase n=1 Tax=Terrimicrobium sacchariphilum TaxID=690879 RepID=A0A146G5L6_TERSA|nr:DEAD/DEAH box helicase [Terrimicrobium sacchariphilum]GAT32683.1 DEAD/DEAH box helicase [Terrimicrobium sacchariphilum]